ncbi:MAG: beta-ketoacyl-[acyl-carrier-protein] synthase family protein [Acidobacteriia bacterium]|nr:beta-ketoacyl-[acyl-carrier-protein] synthase family protein [Terriglobia bacterium]
MPCQIERRRVVVTGYGMITPLGPNAGETFARAAEGQSGIGPITSFDVRGLPCGIAGQVDDSWLGGAVAMDRDGRFAARAARLMLVAATEAAQAAALTDVEDRNRVAVAIGCHGENPTIEEILFLHRFTDGNGRWDAAGLTDAGGYDVQQFFRRKPDVAAALVAGTLDCRGPNLTLVSACAAGAQAIGEARRLIAEGSCDVALAGGCEATVDFVGLLGFSLLKALAEIFASPRTASRPFDRRRNGFVLAEGAGAMVLEELCHARARGARVLGEVLGYGDSADAYRITDSRPDGQGAALAMRGALADAGISSAAVQYVNAHGTSTVQGDIAEARAIKEVLGTRAREVPVSSNKSMLGHTIAAAGAIEAALTLMGMERSVILPTINHEVPDPRCDLDCVPNAARRQPHRVALSNSFGFGGQNACLCLGCCDA